MCWEHTREPVERRSECRATHTYPLATALPYTHHCLKVYRIATTMSASMYAWIQTRACITPLCATSWGDGPLKCPLGPEVGGGTLGPVGSVSTMNGTKLGWSWYCNTNWNTCPCVTTSDWKRAHATALRQPVERRSECRYTSTMTMLLTYAHVYIAIPVDPGGTGKAQLASQYVYIHTCMCTWYNGTIMVHMYQGMYSSYTVVCTRVHTVRTCCDITLYYHGTRVRMYVRTNVSTRPHITL